jgi:hypothetical protein
MRVQTQPGLNDSEIPKVYMVYRRYGWIRHGMEILSPICSRKLESREREIYSKYQSVFRLARCGLALHQTLMLDQHGTMVEKRWLRAATNNDQYSRNVTGIVGPGGSVCQRPSLGGGSPAFTGKNRCAGDAWRSRYTVPGLIEHGGRGPKGPLFSSPQPPSYKHSPRFGVNPTSEKLPIGGQPC